MRYTTIEESKRLLKAGVKPDTADMAYYSDDRIEYYKRPVLSPWSTAVDKDYYLPCWSSDALIELLENPIIKQFNKNGAIVWDCNITLKDGTLVTSDASVTLFGAVYDIVCKIFEKTYIKPMYY